MINMIKGGLAETGREDKEEQRARSSYALHLLPNFSVIKT